MKILKTKWAAWAAFILVLVLLVGTFSLRTAWWAFIDIFFAFMAAFTNLLAVTVSKMNPYVSKKLYFWAFIFCVLWVLSLIGEWIAFGAA